MIEWLRSNVPFARYEVARHEPPLPYPDHYFDLVINHSVLSHLDERRQDDWLAELQRVTRPGALLLLTVEGQSTWARTRSASENAGEDVGGWQAVLETRGILFIENDGWVGSTHPGFYHSTIHAPWYVFEHWGEFFDIEAYLPDGSWSQDLVVLRRRADGALPSWPAIGRRLALTGPHQVHAAAKPTRPSAYGIARVIARRLPRALRHRGGKRASRHSELDTQQLIREMDMLRLGLYEQGKRISVLAEQLRDEIRALSSDDHPA